MTDISDRRRAADALERSRAEFVSDALCSVPWYRSPPTMLRRRCGCIWYVTERADEGGAYPVEVWESCEQCAAVLGGLTDRGDSMT